MCIPSFILIGCCLLLFYKNYIVYYNVDCYYCVFIEKYVYTKFHLDWLLAIVMYGLRLFIVVLQELQCLPNCLHTYMVKVRGCYHITKICCTTLSSFWDS